MLSPDAPHHHSATWSLENIKKLIELWRDHTAGQIGSMLGLTRNAVIGKANRMHLERKHNNPPKPRPEREHRFVPKPPMPPPKPEPPPPPEAPVSLGLTIYELEPGQCRYPEGEVPPYLFCGHAVKDGSSYCQYHHRVCCFPVSPARREMARPISDWRGIVG